MSVHLFPRAPDVNLLDPRGIERMVNDVIRHHANQIEDAEVAAYIKATLPTADVLPFPRQEVTIDQEQAS